MPLIITVGDAKAPYDKKQDHQVPHGGDGSRFASRHVRCNGCGIGIRYSAEQWVFTPEQVASWYAEHKDHQPEEVK